MAIVTERIAAGEYKHVAGDGTVFYVFSVETDRGVLWMYEFMAPGAVVWSGRDDWYATKRDAVAAVGDWIGG